jgi:hypothetical protein
VVTPHSASALSNVGTTPKMPIDPVIVAGSAKIRVPGVATH